MKVYRITKTLYAGDLEGTGSKLYGGRWNSVGTPCIYTSESRALAILEYTVNANIDMIPRRLSLCVFEIDEKRIQSVQIKDLPGNWTDIPAPSSTKEFGSAILAADCAILRIPSIVVPDEFNYILNPLVENNFELLEVNDFVFDLRIK